MQSTARSTRDPYLDLLRAGAILLVLFHHVVQEWPIPQPWLTPYSSKGAFGVDLFFVLSGWLIGGLYWREVKQTGRIALWRFWLRRWIRTIPPYLGGLGLAWSAVALYRSQPFNVGYLVFLQNYYDQVPFFLVSWSLCVEEHFYLFVPLIFFLIGTRHLLDRQFAIVLLMVVPVASRVAEYTAFDNAVPYFGYFQTASHFNADGLLLGFAAGYLAFYKGFEITARQRVILFLCGIAAFLSVSIGLPPLAARALDKLLIAFGFLSILMLGVSARWSQWTGPRLVRGLATISYSVYLTHALVIHVVVKLFGPTLGDLTLAFLVVEAVAITLAGTLFYVLFEKTSLAIRKRLAPAG